MRMPFNRDEILNVVAQLAEQENLRVTVKESAKGACIVGSSAFAGGLFGGPVGLAIGGMLGSVASLWYGHGKYRSVVDVITYDLTSAQKHRLADSVQRVMEDVRLEDIAMLLPMLLANASLKELVLLEVTKFIQSELSMSIAA